MGISSRIREKISIEVIKALVTRFENFPEEDCKNRNAPFHEAFLRAFSEKISSKVFDVPFFISLSSWLQGLNTTLGQTFFENVANYLCEGEKREYTSKKLGNLTITKKQKETVSKIVTDLSNSTCTPDMERENKLLMKSGGNDFANALDFSADVFYEDDENIFAIELKSVKPNSGEMRGEKQKILEGKVALQRKYPNKKVHFFIGFPFDPTVDPLKESVTSSSNKARFLKSIINMNKFFDHKETLLSSELWDYLSGKPNTMEEILEIINVIAKPDFLEKFQYLNDKDNRNKKEYISLLYQWFLCSEAHIIKNEKTIIKNIKNDLQLTRLFNKTPFDSKGKYNFDRYNALKSVI